MESLADAVGAFVGQMQRTAPKVWREIAQTVAPVTDPAELAALRARPDAAALLEGDAVRIMGLVNAVFVAARADVDAELGALRSQISELQEQVHGLSNQ